MNANDTQVAGTHYRTTFQHWDLAMDLKLGYFEGQISKYVTRHRTKNGLQDLQKALHFAQKLRETVRTYGNKPMRLFPTETQINDFVKANCLNLREHIVLKALLSWSTARDLDNVVGFLEQLILAEYGLKPDPA